MAPDVPKRGRSHWAFLATLFAGLLGLAILRAFTTPDPRGHGTHEQLGLPPCMMMEFTGIPCPGCGVTTSLSRFVHGDIRASIAVHPFGALLAFGLLAASVVALVDTLRGADAWARFRRRWKPWMSWSAGIALAAAWIYKIAELRA